jgi:hypothetical protein
MNGIRLALLGAVLTTVGLFAIPRLRPYDDECTSLLGRIAQFGDQSVNLKCSAVETLVDFRGWILGGGIAALTVGLVLIVLTVIAAARS